MDSYKEKNARLENMPMISLKNLVLDYLKKEEGTSHCTSYIASKLGAAYGRDGDKARSRVGYALRKLAETPEVEDVSRLSNKSSWRFVSFEERSERAEALSKRAAKRNLSDTLVRYFERNGYKASRDYRSDDISIDPHELYRFLKDTIHTESI